MSAGVTSKSVCQVLYKEETKLDRVVVDETHFFNLADVWLNNQPAKCLKDFDFRHVNKNTIIDCKPLNDDDIFITFKAEKETVLYIKGEQLKSFVSVLPYPLPVLPELTGYGLRVMIARKLDWKDFDILDEAGSSIDESMAFGHESALLTIEKKDVVIEEAKPPREEGGFGLSLTPFVNFREKVILNIKSDAPLWRTIDRGFNLEGECHNAKCPSFIKKELVCIEKKFDALYQKGGVCSKTSEEFHISEVTCHCICPGCKEELLSENITNCIFLDCKYTITGMKEGETKPFTSEPKIAGKNEPVSYLKDIRHLA